MAEPHQQRAEALADHVGQLRAEVDRLRETLAETIKKRDHALSLLCQARANVQTEIGAIESSWEAYPETPRDPCDAKIHANAVALLAQIDEALK